MASTSLSHADDDGGPIHDRTRPHSHHRALKKATAHGGPFQPGPMAPSYPHHLDQASALGRPLDSARFDSSATSSSPSHLTALPSHAHPLSAYGTARADFQDSKDGRWALGDGNHQIVAGSDLAFAPSKPFDVVYSQPLPPPPAAPSHHQPVYVSCHQAHPPPFAPSAPSACSHSSSSSYRGPIVPYVSDQAYYPNVSEASAASSSSEGANVNPSADFTLTFNNAAFPATPQEGHSFDSHPSFVKGISDAPYSYYHQPQAPISISSSSRSRSFPDQDISPTPSRGAFAPSPLTERPPSTSQLDASPRQSISSHSQSSQNDFDTDDSVSGRSQRLGSGDSLASGEMQDDVGSLGAIGASPASGGSGSDIGDQHDLGLHPSPIRPPMLASDDCLDLLDSYSNGTASPSKQQSTQHFQENRMSPPIGSEYASYGLAGPAGMNIPSKTLAPLWQSGHATAQALGYAPHEGGVASPADLQIPSTPRRSSSDALMRKQRTGCTPTIKEDEEHLDMTNGYLEEHQEPQTTSASTGNGVVVGQSRHRNSISTNMLHMHLNATAPGGGLGIVAGMDETMANGCLPEPWLQQQQQQPPFERKPFEHGDEEEYEDESEYISSDPATVQELASRAGPYIRHLLDTEDRMAIGERVILVFSPKVGQKSYGNEHRFMCPPPAVMLLGSSWILDTGMAVPDHRNRFATFLAAPEVVVALAHNKEQWRATRPTWTLRTGEVVRDDTTGSRDNVISGRAVAKDLHIPSTSDERASKAVRAVFEVASSAGPNRQRIVLGEFMSKSIKVVSKPGSKRGTSRNNELLLTHGSQVSVFNRVRSQSVSTKFLSMCAPGSGFGNQEWEAMTGQPYPVSTQTKSGLATSVEAWEPFIIWAVDPHRLDVHNEPKDPLPLGYPRHPPAGALPYSTNSPPTLHYNQPVILQSRLTGANSPIFILRAVDRQTYAVGGADDRMLRDKALLAASGVRTVANEPLGDPIAQLSKVALEQWEPPLGPARLLTNTSLDNCPSYLTIMGESVGMQRHTEGRMPIGNPMASPATAPRTALNPYNPGSPAGTPPFAMSPGPSSMGRPRSRSQAWVSSPAGVTSQMQMSSLGLPGSISPFSSQTPLSCQSSYGDMSEASTAPSSAFYDHTGYFDGAVPGAADAFSMSMAQKPSTAAISPLDGRQSASPGLGARPVGRARSSTIASMQTPQVSTEGGKVRRQRRGSASMGVGYGAAAVPAGVDQYGRRMSGSSGPGGGGRGRSVSFSNVAASNSSEKKLGWELDLGEPSVWTIVNVEVERYSYWVPENVQHGIHLNPDYSTSAPIPYYPVMPPRLDRIFDPRHARHEDEPCQPGMITLHGEYFDQSLHVFFDDIPSRRVEYASEEHIFVQPPPASCNHLGRGRQIVLVRKDGVVFPTPHRFSAS